MELGHTIQADARWHVYAFGSAANPGVEGSAIRTLCDHLASNPASPILRHTLPGPDIDAVIDFRAVFQQSVHDIALEAMPPILVPRKGRLGLVDYEKMFCADNSPGRDIYELRGIDRKDGCLVIVRPDQYVAHVLPLTAHEELARFFAGVLLPATAAPPLGADQAEMVVA